MIEKIPENLLKNIKNLIVEKTQKGEYDFSETRIYIQEENTIFVFYKNSSNFKVMEMDNNGKYCEEFYLDSECDLYSFSEIEIKKLPVSKELRFLEKFFNRIKG